MIPVDGNGAALCAYIGFLDSDEFEQLIAQFETGRVLWGCRFSAFCRSASDLLIRASCA